VPGTGLETENGMATLASLRDTAEPGDGRLQRLIGAALPGAVITRVTPLGNDAAPEYGTTKGTGYGAPLRIDVEQAGKLRSVVLHSATANSFGHDRRSDRAAEALLAADTFGTIPGHVQVLDVGAFDFEGGVVSLRRTGEFYLLSEWAEGRLYAEDLRRIANTGLEARDLSRLDRLLDYLLALHQNQVSRLHARERALRDLLGSGEGIFGIVDSYPRITPGVTRGRLQRIERQCHDWRWRLKDIGRPLVRIHGDFHPFNLLFDAGDELRLLDTSRGSLGDAADDVSCLTLNFVFFALGRESAWRDAFSALWARFWDGYLARGDAGVLEVAAPYFAWRALVLANPVWYPELSAEARGALLGFVELALEAERFSPKLVECLF
jgi:hypothetical protein